jgi:hypothetical protein
MSLMSTNKDLGPNQFPMFSRAYFKAVDKWNKGLTAAVKAVAPEAYRHFGWNGPNWQEAEKVDAEYQITNPHPEAV